MSGMIDTMVLIYAMSDIGKRPPSRAERRQKIDDEKLSLMVEASKKLLKRHPTVIVSAVSVIEFMRRIREHERVPYESILPHLEVLPVDLPVANKASALLRDRDGDPSVKVCRRCLNSTKDTECVGCKLRISSYQRINDAIVAATAEVTDKVTVLYTFDGPIKNGFGDKLKNCAIIDPLTIDFGEKPDGKQLPTTGKLTQGDLFAGFPSHNASKEHGQGAGPKND